MKFIYLLSSLLLVAGCSIDQKLTVGQQHSSPASSQMADELPSTWKFLNLPQISLEIPMPPGTTVESDPTDSYRLKYNPNHLSYAEIKVNKTVPYLHLIVDHRKIDKPLAAIFDDLCIGWPSIHEKHMVTDYKKIGSVTLKKLQTRCDKSISYFLEHNNTAFFFYWSYTTEMGKKIIETALSHLRFTDSSSSNSQQ